jgi:hypothetical protein
MANIPTNELNIKHTTGDTVYFYGMDIKLSQNDLPYIIPQPEQRRIPSLLNFVVYGDTVTLDGHLANPGKNFSIYARKINFNDGAFIDVAGPDPDIKDDHSPGVPAEQKDPAAGAAGTAGANGGKGLSSGNVTLIAESFEKQASDQQGPFQINSFVNDICNHCLTMVKQTQFPVPLKITNPQQSIILNILEFKSDFQNAAIYNTTWDQTNQNFTLHLSLKNLSFIGTGYLNENKNLTIPIHWTQQGIDIVAQWPIDLQKKATSPGKVDIIFGDWDYHWEQYSKYKDQELDLILLKGSIQPAIESLIKDQLSSLGNPFPISGIAGTSPDLFISCKGGHGGRGQDGHDGIKGYDANRGNDNYANGGPGGQGGNAGHSGQGGPGGTVNVGFIKSTMVSIFYDNVGGNGGSPATPGNGGQGGKGDSLPNQFYEALCHPGKNGDPASFKGTAGDPGNMGALAVNSLSAPGGDIAKPLQYAELAPLMKVEQLLITQREVNLAYLNATQPENYQYVMNVANWLVNITQPLIQTDFNHPDWDQHDIAIAKSINDKSMAMITNFQRGLDFYGNYPNWVPVLTLDSYQERIGQLINLGKIIEEQFTIYINDQNAATQRTAALDQARQQLSDHIQYDDKEIEQIAAQIKQMNTVIDDQLAQLQSQQSLIANDKQIFADDVRKQAEAETGCSFEDILKTVTGILQFGAAIGDGVGAIAGAYKLYKEFNTTKDKCEKVVKVIQKVEATIKDIKTGLQDVNKAITSPDEVGLVITNKTDFDDFIKKYTDKFPSAKTLKNAVDHYFDLINARNQNILSYNALYGKMAAVQADINQKTSQLEKIAAKRQQQIADPALPEYTSFMQNAYDNLKMVIIKKLYEENRAYWYWSLEENPFAASDLTIANLAVMQDDIYNAIDTAKEHRNGPFQPFNQIIPITINDYPFSFQALPTTKKLVFSLPVSLSCFLNKFQVIGNEFKLEFPDIKDNSVHTLSLTLIHNGISYQTPSSKTGPSMIQFVHLPRVIPYNIDFTNPNNTDGGLIGSTDEGFTGLSPFATWTLNFDHPGNNFDDPQKENYLDLKLIQSVDITFTGTYLGPDLLSSHQTTDQNIEK